MVIIHKLTEAEAREFFPRAMMRLDDSPGSEKPEAPVYAIITYPSISAEGPLFATWDDTPVTDGSRTCPLLWSVMRQEWDY